jgi:hypothetical protein
VVVRRGAALRQTCSCAATNLLSTGARRAVRLPRAQVAGGPLTGLVHISEAADEYVTDLAQLFSPGQGARPGPARLRAGYMRMLGVHRA